MGLFYEGNAVRQARREIKYMPSWYNEQHLTNELFNMFRGEKSLYSKHTEHFKEAEHMIKGDRWTFGRYSRFLRNFPESDIFKLLNSVVAPEQATDIVMDMMGTTPESEMCDIDNKEPLPEDLTGLEAGGFKRMDKQQIDRIYEINEALKNLMLKYVPLSKVEEKLIESPYPEDTVEPVLMSSYSDVCKLLSREHTLDEELFDYRLAKKELMKLKHYKVEEKPKDFIMLLDISSSMRSGDGSADIYAAASAIAFIRNIEKSGGNKGRMAMFDNYMHLELDRMPFNYVINGLLSQKFQGGGTDIDDALNWADKELGETDGEIIIITDGSDSVSSIPTRHRLHTIFLNGNNEELKSISDSYESVTTSTGYIHAQENIVDRNETRKHGYREKEECEECGSYDCEC